VRNGDIGELKTCTFGINWAIDQMSDGDEFSTEEIHEL
jgi:hypothetical protein